MKLVIGSKNYSSWSMRAWLLLHHFGLEFEEESIALFQPGFKAEIAKYSKLHKVPILLDKNQVIWDSLAICEYISETYLGNQGYPNDPMIRAKCRSYCSEMHAGFPEIRNTMPMNCRAQRRINFTPKVLLEIERVEQLWAEALSEFGGPYLFREFSIADCMYAPLVMRFKTYGCSLTSRSKSYAEALLSNNSVSCWREAAAQESQILQNFEVGISNFD